MIVLLCFALYLRPGEPHRIRTKHVIAPSNTTSGARFVTIVLNPYEDGRASKTQEYDESLLIDNELLPELGRRILRHAKERGVDQPLFSVSQQQVALDLQAAAARLRVPSSMNLVMYMLRHSGASTDFALKLRTLAEIKLRGRWRGDQSLRRYEKGGRLAEQLARLPDKLRAHAVRCAQCVNAVLRGSASALGAP